MEAIIRFKHPDRGRSVGIRNSWGDYLRTGFRKVRYLDKSGAVQTFDLPPGCFCTTIDVFASMLSQRDSMAYAGVSGWKKVSIDNTP